MRHYGQAGHRESTAGPRLLDSPAMSTPELFYFEGCPYAQRVHLTLLEKGVQYTPTAIDPQQRPPWFRDISPYGKSPLLRHDGQVIYESGIIDQYLDEVFPNPPLLPADPYRRAMARIWMDYCDTRFQPALYRLLAGRKDEGQRRDLLAVLMDCFRFMETEGLQQLGAAPFWMGAHPTLVDIHFLPFFERFALCEELAGAAWPTDCPRLRQWYDTMTARPSFIATRHTLDFHLDRLYRREAQQSAH